MNSVNSSDKETVLVYLMLGISIGVFIVAIFVMAVFKYRQNQLQSLTKSIEVNVDTQLAQMGKDELTASQAVNQLKYLNLILTGRTDYGQFLNDFQTGLYKQTKITSIAKTAANKYEIRGEVSDFDALAKALKSIRNLRSVGKADLYSVDLRDGRVLFDAKLQVAESDYRVKGVAK